MSSEVESSELVTVTRAYRVALNPTAAQEEMLRQHAGASRNAYNTALAAKMVSRRVWEERVAAAVEQGMTEADARKAIKVKVPQAGVIDKARVRVRGCDRAGNPCMPEWRSALDIFLAGGIDQEVAERILAEWAGRCADPGKGIAPWLSQVPNALVQRAEKDADVAWKNWMDSFKGRRSGRRVGIPRFKRAGGRDSFYLTNTESGIVANPGHRTRTLKLGGKLGEVRVVPCPMIRRVTRSIQRGARILSMTVSRGGHRWWVSILCVEQMKAPRVTKRAFKAGTVGVHLGVGERATLSTGEVIENPRVKITHARSLVKAQRRLSRTGWIEDDDGNRRPTQGRIKARAKVAKLSALEAARRGTHTHHVSKRLARDWAQIAFLDLGVQDMTKSSKRSGLHGWDAKAKRNANRDLLDLAPFELRRQAAYKAAWRGAAMHIVERGTPVTRACSQCGLVKSSAVREGEFVCECGFALPRNLNAARNLERLAKGEVEPPPSVD